MKVLLVDEDTLKTVSLVSTMSEIMKQDVFLVEQLHQNREPLEHLKCVCFVRPTNENIKLLSQELAKPNYAMYHIFFSHTLTKQLLKVLAEADEYELVVDVHEYYADFRALSPFTFEFDLPVSLDCHRGMSSHALTRCTSGLTSVLLALQLTNPLIRYQNDSEAARALAESIRSLISRESTLFDRKPQSDNASFVLLLLDRRSDPITPLLTQWTYEAMIHELIGIRQNKVNLARVPNIREEMREIMLSREHDEFYRQNQFSNYGEIGQSIKHLVEEYQSVSKSVNDKPIETISDMKHVLENYPSLRKQSGNVETHFTLVSELSRLVKDHALMNVSEAEQELVCHDKPSESRAKISSLLNDPRVLLSDAVRLVLLYALRYGTHHRDFQGMIKLLQTRGAGDKDIYLIEQLQSYAISRSKADGLSLFDAVKIAATSGSHSLNGQSASSTVAGITKRFVKGLKGIDNVYTQHEPLLKEIVEDLVKGKLRTTSFPILPIGSRSPPPQIQQRPKKICLFVVGGMTYEETCTVHTLNSTLPDVDIIIGGTYVHNSRSFLEEVCFVTRDAATTKTAQQATGSRDSAPVYRSNEKSRGGGARYTQLK